MTIPIIGQPKIGNDWLFVLPMTCTCGESFILVGQVNAERKCPREGCTKAYRLLRMPTQDPVTLEVGWPVGVKG